MSQYSLNSSTSFNWADDDEDDWQFDTWKQEHGHIAQPTIEELGPLQQDNQAEPSYDVSRAVNESPEAADGAETAVVVEYRTVDPETCFAWRRMAIVDGQGGEACKRNNYYRDWKECQYERINFRSKHMRHMSLDPSPLWQLMEAAEANKDVLAKRASDVIKDTQKEHLQANECDMGTSDEDTPESTSPVDTRPTTPSTTNKDGSLENFDQSELSCFFEDAFSDRNQDPAIPDRCDQYEDEDTIIEDVPEAAVSIGEDCKTSETKQKLNACTVGLAFTKQPPRMLYYPEDHPIPSPHSAKGLENEDIHLESSGFPLWSWPNVGLKATQYLGAFSVGILAVGLAHRCLSRK